MKLVALDAAQLEAALNVASNGRVEQIRRLHDGRRVAPQTQAVAPMPHRSSLEQELTRRWDQAVQGAQERRLAGSVGADHHVDPAAYDQKTADVHEIGAMHAHAQLARLDDRRAGAHATLLPRCWTSVIA